MSGWPVLLGVTGGIAAYKACDLTRLFVRAGHEVIPLVTHGAERFVQPRDLPWRSRTGSADESPYPHLCTRRLS